MSQDTEEYKQPRTVISQPLEIVEDFRLQMGTINYNYQFGHFFFGSSGLMDLISQFNIWLKDIMEEKLPTDTTTKYKIPPQLPQEQVLEMKQLWYGGDEQRNIKPAYLYQMRNRHQDILKQRIIFKIPAKLTAYESIWQFPALMHFNPKSKTKDATDQRILLQEEVAFDIAWDGYDPDQLADVVKYKKTDGANEIAIFTSDEEIMQSEAETMEVGRKFYHKVIRLLLLEFNPRRHFVFYEMKKILRTYQKLKRIQGALREMGQANDFVVS